MTTFFSQWTQQVNVLRRSDLTTLFTQVKNLDKTLIIRSVLRKNFLKGAQQVTLFLSTDVTCNATSSECNLRFEYDTDY